MTLTEITQAIRDLSDPEFRALQAEMWTINREREARTQVEAGQAKIVAELQEAGKLEKPESATAEQARTDTKLVPQWRNPGTDHSLMYHQGDVVQHDGKLVRSTHPSLNHWAPGTLAFDGRIWEIIGTVEETTPDGDEGDQDAGETTPEPELEPAEPAAPAFKQPSGGHDAYKQGDRVTYNGSVYESIINGNVWTPESYPQGWKKL